MYYAILGNADKGRAGEGEEERGREGEGGKENERGVRERPKERGRLEERDAD